MTNLAATRGDDETYDLAFTEADGSALDLTGVQEIWFTAKRWHRDADADAVIAKTKTGGGITVVNPPTNGQATLKIDAADTADLAGRRIELVWDCQVKDAAGLLSTVDSGTLTVEPDVTVATA